MLTAKKPVRLILEVSDPIIPSNQGRFEVNIDKNGGRLKETKKLPDLSINIADLNRLFFGKSEDKELEGLIIKEELNEINFISGLFINDVV